MKALFKPGDQKVFTKMVTQEDAATFHGVLLHPVYSTFALARDFEWSSRLFFLECKDEDEEGIGTFLQIEHKAPAKVDDTVTITATVESIIGNELICIIEARSGSKIIATGKTGQKMLKKERIKRLFEHG